LQSLYEVWGEGGSWEELEASIRGGLPARDPAHLAPGASWCIRVDGFGCGIGDPVATLNRLSFVPFQGPVQLRDPDNQFRLIQVCLSVSSILTTGLRC
jgi:tRNA (guanine10-N2)-methyltransferase